MLQQTHLQNLPGPGLWALDLWPRVPNHTETLYANVFYWAFIGIFKYPKTIKLLKQGKVQWHWIWNDLLGYDTKGTHNKCQNSYIGLYQNLKLHRVKRQHNRRKLLHVLYWLRA